MELKNAVKVVWMIYSIEKGDYIEVNGVDVGIGDKQTWATKTSTVMSAAGVHDLYLKFTGGSSQLFSFNWWKFNSIATGTGSAGGNCFEMTTNTGSEISL